MKIAINGFGRIGRNVLRAVYESKRNNEIQIVAVNDMADINTLAHLLRHDSVHGHFNGEVNDKGQFVWTIKSDSGVRRFIIGINQKGQWHEIGEFSRDGENWYQFFEMSLDKVKELSE